MLRDVIYHGPPLKYETIICMRKVQANAKYHVSKACIETFLLKICHHSILINLSFTKDRPGKELENCLTTSPTTQLVVT